jgi:signal transduction histidine kinase
VELVLKLPDEPIFTRADRGQFDTAIVNMAINARDAMNGEGVLTIEVGPAAGIPAIRRHHSVNGDYIAVTIRDTGTGIAAEDVDRIFEPFFTTKAVGAGTGLGLSQVIGFAKQSGGDVRVTSEWAWDHLHLVPAQGRGGAQRAGARAAAGRAQQGRGHMRIAGRGQ